MEGVAERAGTGKQTLYRRWPRKPLLIFAAMLGGQEAVEAQIPDTGSLAGDLAAITAQQALIYGTADTLDLVQGLLADCLAEPRLLEELQIRVLRPRLAVLERVAYRAKDRGEVADDLSPSTLARVVAGAMFATLVIFGGADASFAPEVARLAERGSRR